MLIYKKDFKYFLIIIIVGGVIMSNLTEQSTVHNDFQLLSIKLNLIKRKEWIESVNKGRGSAGLTLEKQLGIQQNEFNIPDFKSIELKTKRYGCKRPITLFSSVPDGPGFHEVERLRNDYGYSHSTFKNYKVLGCNICSSKLTKTKSGFYLKLDLSRQQRKIFISIYNRKKHLIENKVYWDFDTLKEKLDRKLKFLSLVSYLSKSENNQVYFKYYKSEFFVLKGFNQFIDLLETGKISIILKIGIYTDKNRLGKTYDHGCSFVIEKSDLYEMYKKYNV